jgi:molybdopterin-guanine dinucleotide biosynthesis protein A
MPFLNVSLLRHLLSLREGYDAIVPVTEGYPEPTHAAYSKACLPVIQRQLARGELKIARFFDRVRVRQVPEDEVRRFDPDLRSFFNINTPEDLAQALALVREGTRAN